MSVFVVALFLSGSLFFCLSLSLFPCSVGNVGRAVSHFSFPESLGAITPLTDPRSQGPGSACRRPLFQPQKPSRNASNASENLACQAEPTNPAGFVHVPKLNRKNILVILRCCLDFLLTTENVSGLCSDQLTAFIERCLFTCTELLGLALQRLLCAVLDILQPSNIHRSFGT